MEIGKIYYDTTQVKVVFIFGILNDSFMYLALSRHMLNNCGLIKPDDVHKYQPYDLSFDKISIINLIERSTEWDNSINEKTSTDIICKYEFNYKDSELESYNDSWGNEWYADMDKHLLLVPVRDQYVRIKLTIHFENDKIEEYDF